MKEPIEIEQFFAADIRVGEVTRVQVNEKARTPAYILTVDLGDSLGERQASAQLTGAYEADDLIGRQVLAVVNLPAKRVAGVKSEILVLGAVEATGRTIVLQPERKVANGTAIA